LTFDQTIGSGTGDMDGGTGPSSGPD
jgi:hypothetical protein